MNNYRKLARKQKIALEKLGYNSKYFLRVTQNHKSFKAININNKRIIEVEAV